MCEQRPGLKIGKEHQGAQKSELPSPSGTVDKIKPWYKQLAEFQPFDVL